MRWLAAGLLCFWAMNAAAEIILDDDPAWPLSVDAHVRVLEDPSGAMRRDDVLASPDFAPARPDGLRPGFTRSAWWLGIAVSNAGPHRQSLRLTLGTPRLQYVEFHVRRAGAWSTSRAGLGYPADEIAPRREPTLAFDLAPGESLRILVRVSGLLGIQMQPRLYSAQALNDAEAGVTFADGILLGGLAALTLYAALLWLLSFDSVFLLQTLTYAAFCLHQAAYRGYAKAYLWPDATEWAVRSIRLFGTLFPAMFALYILLLARRESLYLPGERLLWAMVAGLLAIAAMSLRGELLLSGWLAVYGVLAASVGMAIVGILFARSRPAYARLVFPTVGVLLAGAALRVLQIEGLTPPLSPHLSGILTIAELAIVLLLLAAWVISVRSGRAAAQESLEAWQAQVQGRLRAEVEHQTVALHRALGEAEDINREQTRTLGYVGHDLRTPLATIIGHARALRELAPGHGRQVKAIERSAQYQLALIDELLEYAKGELHVLTIDPAPVRLAPLLDDIAQYADALAAQQGNRFVFESEPGLPGVVMLDARRLQQVLLNLLSNAAKFTREGQIRLAVGARQVGSRWQLRFAVADTGVGIGDESHARIFDAFHQVTQAGGGVGLGLFIARRIVAIMGGTLEVESQAGQGSTFRFQVPTTLAAAGAVPEPAPAAPVRPAEAPAAGGAGAVCLDEGERRELIELAQGGDVTGIEEWLLRVSARHPEAGAFFDEVGAALDELDLDGIQALVLAR